MRKTWTLAAIPWLLFAACGDDGGGGAESEAESESEAEAEAEAESEAEAEAESEAESESEAEAESESEGECGALATFEDGLSPSGEIHVATDGDDSGGDGSAASPFATIERAAEDVGPGDAIVVHEGTYAGDQYLADLAGDDGAPIWIGGADGEARPVLSGGGEALHLTAARWLIVHDLEVTGATDNGINCDDGGAYDDEDATRYAIFRDLYVHDIGTGGNEDCLKLSGVNDYFVIDSEFAACGGGGSGSAVDHVGCHRGLLARNTLRELEGTGIQCKGGSDDIEIRWNFMLGAGVRAVNMGGSTGYAYFRPPLSTGAPNFEARDIRVIANVIRGGETPFAFVGCVECLAANNTIVDPTNWPMRILQETVSDGTYEFLPSGDGVVMNNIFYFEAGAIGKDVNVGPDTDAASFTFMTNLWYAWDDPGASEPVLPSPETGGVYAEDPAFADAAADDYHVGPTGPAVGAGTALDDVAGDLDGDCYADPPSIGADEPL